MEGGPLPVQGDADIRAARGGQEETLRGRTEHGRAFYGIVHECDLGAQGVLGGAVWA